MALDIAWTKTKYTDEKDKKELSSWLTNSPQLRDFREILDELEAQITAQDRSTTQYNSPSWAYSQAHRNGTLEMLNRVRTLLKP